VSSRLNINGVLLLDKPKGISSNNALIRARKLFNANKAGHTGSLDPVASGMLPICFGEATKYAQYLVDDDKTYICEAMLGQVTLSGDSESEVTDQRDTSHLTLQQIQRCLENFMGEIQQVPSMYSALKQNGQRLYKLARQGITVPRDARTINIYDLRVLEFNNPNLVLHIHCSKGTYVRTLIEDLGEQLACGGHVTELRRVQIGNFDHSAMVPLARLEELSDKSSNLEQLLLPIEASVHKFSPLDLSDHQYHNIIQGRTAVVPHDVPLGFVRLFAPERGFVGLGEIIASGQLRPKRMLAF
jgi:tRNA pseudouridine55 synthase